jgi:hypothetical protein
MKAAYADPPYPGQARRHYVDHPDYAGEVDHPALIERLTSEFDAWALSTSSPALRDLLPLCPPNVRVAAWVKPWAVWKPGVRVAYAWEPVLFVSAQSEGHGRRTKDFTSAVAVMRNGHGPQTKGSKSREVCAWLFELLGLEPTDEFHDLFHGSGAVWDAWEWWRSQGQLFDWTRPSKAAALF